MGLARAADELARTNDGVGSSRAPTRRVALWIVVGVGFLAVVSWWNTVSQLRTRGMEPSTIEWGNQAVEWMAWAALGVAIIPLLRRLRTSASRRRALVLHGGLAAGVILVHAAILYGSQRLFGVTDWVVPVWQGALFVARLRLPMNALVYGGIVALVYGIDQAARSRAQSIRVERLATELAQSQLRTLRHRLDPHFLFNALNGVTMLVRSGDQERSVAALAKLGALLRDLVEERPDDLVSLGDELTFVERYLELEQLRIGDRLRVTVSAAPQIREALVPFLVLQPLAENAIRHGIVPTPAAGHIEISADRDGDWLELTVCDDGDGSAAAEHDRSRQGVGLAATRERLERLFGPSCEVVLSTRPAASHTPGGSIARIRLPFFTETLAGQA